MGEIDINNRIEIIFQTMIMTRLHSLLSTRAWNGLTRIEFDPLKLIDMSDEELEIKFSGVKKLGRKSIEEIKFVLKNFKDSEYYKRIMQMMNEKKQEDQDVSKRFLGISEEYDRIFEEGKQKKEGGIKDSSTPKEETERIEKEQRESQLEQLKAKRDKLLEEQRRLHQKLTQAKELLYSYDRLSGNSQENYMANPSEK